MRALCYSNTVAPSFLFANIKPFSLQSLRLLLDVLVSITLAVHISTCSKFPTLLDPTIESYTYLE